MTNFLDVVKAESLGVAARTPSGSRVGVLVLLAAVGWSYWGTIATLSDKWLNDPGYSHGLLVPFFAGYLIWMRRESHFGFSSPAAACGFALLALALACRIVAGLLCFVFLDAVSLIPCLAAAVLLVGGTRLLKWTWPGLVFLFFAIPLPYQVEVALGAPLQRIATIGSAFTLQVLGQPAVAEGNTILLNDIRLGIVEACSGLRMLVTFFAFSTGVALVVRKPILEKIWIVLSAVPIALVTNIIRITATGLMYGWNEKFAKVFFHDLAGWFMMPICLAFLGLELWILNRLVIETKQPTISPLRLQA